MFAPAGIVNRVRQLAKKKTLFTEADFSNKAELEIKTKQTAMQKTSCSEEDLSNKAESEADKDLNLSLNSTSNF